MYRPQAIVRPISRAIAVTRMRHTAATGECICTVNHDCHVTVTHVINILCMPRQSIVVTTCPSVAVTPVYALLYMLYNDHV